VFGAVATQTSQVSVMLERKQSWGWEYQYSRLLPGQGKFCFYNLPLATYRVRMTTPNGWRVCNPSSFRAGGSVVTTVACVY
jgi:hypothetical protein